MDDAAGRQDITGKRNTIQASLSHWLVGLLEEASVPSFHFQFPMVKGWTAIVLGCLGLASWKSLYQPCQSL